MGTVGGGTVHTRVRRTARGPALVAALATVLAGAVSGTAPAGAARAGLSPCVDPDNGVPEVLDVSLSRTSVDVTDQAQQVDVTMTVADAGGPGAASGVERVGATLVAPGWGIGLGLTGRHEGGNTWTATVTVPRGAPPGEYRFRNLDLADRAGNSPGEERVGEVLSQPPFDVALLVTSDEPDTTPPTAGDLSITPNRVDTRRKPRKVRVAVDVRDDLSGVADVRTTLEGHGRRLPLELRERDGRWVGVATIPRWLGRDARRWRLGNLAVRDRLENWRVYRRGTALDELGETGLRVRSGPRDGAAPRLLSARVRPRDVDVRVEGRRVRFVVRLRDARSGVDEVSAGVPARWTELRRTSGTARRGTWKGSIRLTPCSKHLHGSPVRVIAVDRLQNQTDERIGRLRIQGRDNEAPRVSFRENDNWWEPVGPIDLVFDEAVNGVGDDSVTVSRYEYPAIGEPLPGAWSCENRDGSAVDCMTGKVRSASWRPDSPLPTDSSFLVELNPSGVLDVTDLSGNPFRRRTLGGQTD